MVKCRLDQSPLPAVELPLACEQTLAKESLCHLEAAALSEVAVMGDKDVTYVVGIIYEENPLGAESDVNDVAVLARNSRQEPQGVAAKLE
jgi:hypothetical protein